MDYRVGVRTRARLSLSGSAPIKVLAILLLDSRDHASGVQTALTAAGMTAWSADTIESAVQTARNFDADVLLVNGDLPGLNPAAALSTLRATCESLRTAPAILFTQQHQDPALAIESAHSGFDAVLPSPLHVRALPQVIERAARRRRSQRIKSISVRVVENGKLASQSGTQFRAVP